MQVSKRVQSIYESGLPLFEEVYVLYPDYNDICSSDHEEAVYHILDQLDDKHSLSEDERDTLNDMISGGLA